MQFTVWKAFQRHKR